MTEFAGLSIASPPNRLKAGLTTVASNLRAYRRNTVMLRNALTDAILTVGSAINNLARMNDSTPAGPSSGFTYIISASTNMYVGSTGTLTPEVTGMSGNQVSIVPFRPNTSVRPWAYIGDSSPYPSVTVDGGFHCTGAVKISSTGVSRKMGVAEPQAAPTVTFPGGGSGPSQIFYYFTYYASETGAESNPSPVSIPGTNSQSNPTETIPATSHSNFIFNGTQYEFSGSQLRTTGSVGPGVTTDYISVNNLGFAIPAGVTIDGISVDLNWVGQSSGTGTLTTVSLFYLGGPYGNSKFPGTPNQSISVDTIQGGNGDTWGATLTPDVINDSTFGFGIQITTQLAGGSDRSFVNSMGITVFYSTQDADITPVPSTDPQVDKINIYRQGGGLANPTYVGTTSNTTATFEDKLSDLGAATNRELEFDNYEPFPSIDLPRSGTLNATANVLTSVSGDVFNIRWLPGTIMLIGPANAQVAYTAVRRPTSTTSWDFTNNDPTVPTIPDGSGLIWNIAEPDLAAQPLPYLFGPTDNVNFMYGVGDPLRPGTLYWSKGNNLDSAPDTNQMEVTDPSEALVNGAMSVGLGVLFSIKRAWVIQPNFYNALATVTGTSGSTWTLQETAINRGLFIPRCVAVEGGGKIFFRVDDGILMSIAGGPPQSITDQTLYPLFVHEGSVPQPVIRNGVTVYPPDDSQPEKQSFQINISFLYWDYLDTNGTRTNLAYHILTNAWSLDQYSTSVTTHAANEGLSVQGALVGCTDGTLRQLSSGGTEVVTGKMVTAAIGGEGWQVMKELTIEYLSNAPFTISFIAADADNGSYAPQPITVPSSGGEATKLRLIVSPNKWRWLQFAFSSTDLTMQVYLDGLALVTRNWGSTAAWSQVQPFSSTSGGLGAQS